VWPDFVQTIQETQVLDFATKLKRLHGFLPVVFAGLAGLLWLYVIRFKQMVPITPLVIIGIWSLFGPARFTMYLAPFIGIGVGVLIELMAKQAGGKLWLRPLGTTILSIALMLAVFFPTISYTAYNDIPGPVVPAATINAFLEIKRIVPKHSAMLTWWDNGNPLMEIGDFATYHDNSTHGGLRSTLIAKAGLPRQEDMAVLPLPGKIRFAPFTSCRTLMESTGVDDIP
jgi:dolichyl-diphosphooligosaccharide--protein glycosyltransferase